MAKKSNRPKSEQTKEEKPLESTENKKKKSINFKGINSQKMRVGLGLSLVFVSLIMLVAFTSYLFTGNYDQNILNSGIDELGTKEVRNWLGKFGATLSQKFVGDWFGLAAFVFIPIIFRLGVKALFHVSIIPSKIVFKYSMFILIWTPPFFAFLFQSDSLLILGGGIGHTITHFLTMSIGAVGALLLILFVLAAFVLINFNVQLQSAFSSPKNANDSDPISNELDEELAMNHYNGRPISDPAINKPHEEITHFPVVEPPSEKRLEYTNELIPTEDPIVTPEKEPVPAPDSLETSLVAETVSEPTEEVPLKMEPPKDEIKEPNLEESIEAISLSTNIKETPKPVVTADTEIEVKVGEEEEVLDDKEIKDLAKEFGEYDPELDLSKYQKPSLDLLKDFGDTGIEIDRTELEENKNRIITTLKNYKIEISEISAVIGPTVTLYEIVPAPGVRISKIKNLEDDIALSLSALGIRIIAPIPGKGTIGIEVPNKKSEIVSMKTMLASDKFQNTDMILPVALGKTISNESYIADLAKMPHLLMAGATGQGKSVGLNAILVSLLYKLHPSQLKFVLVDPKKVELTLYNKIERHYLAKLPDTDEAIITDTQKVVNTLNSLCMEMDQRYDLLKDAMARTIVEYNDKFVKRKLNPEKGHRFLPYIVLVIDEFADLIMTAGKEVETPIARLAQLARAIGIHLIVATQRPSVNVITGMIKANFPARLAFRVTSKIDSRTILDSGGADQLIGRGDLLFSPGNEILRLQCPFVDTPEVERICDFIGEQQGYSDAFLLPEFVGESAGTQNNMSQEDRDALFDEAAKIIVQHQSGSASLLQRRLKLGYNRAGRIIDQLEAAGIIGPFSGSKGRDVLVTDEASLAQILKGSSE